MQRLHTALDHQARRLASLLGWKSIHFRVMGGLRYHTNLFASWLSHLSRTCALCLLCCDYCPAPLCEWLIPPLTLSLLKYMPVAISRYHVLDHIPIENDALTVPRPPFFP